MLASLLDYKSYSKHQADITDLQLEGTHDAKPLTGCTKH